MLTPLAARFRARLEAGLADAERVLGSEPKRVIAAGYRGMDRAGPFPEEMLQRAAKTLMDHPRPALVTFVLFEPAREKAVAHLNNAMSRARDRNAALALPFMKFSNQEEAWPAEMPEHVTTAHALAVVRENADALAVSVAEEAEAFIRLVPSSAVPPEVRAAMLARDELVERWLFSQPFVLPVAPELERKTDSHRAAWLCLDALRAGVELAQRNPEAEAGAGVIRATGTMSVFGKSGAHTVPPEVALLDAIRWARESLEQLDVDGQAAAIEKQEEANLQELQRREEFLLRDPDGGPNRVLSPYALGLLFFVWREVEGNRRKIGIALDAGNAHRSVLEGLVHLPKDPRKEWKLHEEEGGYFELLAPGGEPQQFVLTLPGEHMAEQLQQAIRTLRGFKGIRHWLAFQVGFTGPGRRLGTMRWTVDEHLDALRVPRRQRRPEVIAEAVRMAELFLALEILHRKTPTARDFERGPVFHVHHWHGRQNAGQLRLDGVEFRINPWLYSGVRKTNGDMGENFGWAPAELAGVDHARHPHTIALGAVLPVRWRMAYGENEATYVDLGGDRVARAAGLNFKRHNSGRAWNALKRDLCELQRISGVGAWEWRRGDPSLQNVLRLHMPPMMRDRLVAGVRPVEIAATLPITGEELRAWRKGRDLTQMALATACGMGEATVRRVERNASERLTARFREALRRVVEAAAATAQG